ncbi:MAG: hypothetical protein RLZZ314_1848, partial [Bacteroidota bacterium]
MDRNTITGLVLMMALLLGYQWYIAPTEEELAAWEAEQAALQASEDSVALAQLQAAQSQREATQALQQGMRLAADSSASAALQAQLARQYGIFGAAVAGNDRDHVLGNDHILVAFNTRGGMPVSARLTDGYTRYGSDDPIELWVREASSMNVSWDVPGVGRVGFQD